MGKTFKNCTKPNHFAKMCRSQQVNEVTENTNSSDEECNMIQSFDSGDEFEIMSIESNTTSIAQIDEYIRNKVKQKSKLPTNVTENRDVLLVILFAGTRVSIFQTSLFYVTFAGNFDFCFTLSFFFENVPPNALCLIQYKVIFLAPS